MNFETYEALWSLSLINLLMGVVFGSVYSQIGSVVVSLSHIDRDRKGESRMRARNVAQSTSVGLHIFQIQRHTAMSNNAICRKNKNIFNIF